MKLVGHCLGLKLNYLSVLMLTVHFPTERDTCLLVVVQLHHNSKGTANAIHCGHLPGCMWCVD